MAATFGKIEEYVPSRENWAECEERLYFMIANGITGAEQKKAVLITSVGAGKLCITKVNHGARWSKKADLVKVFRDHFIPKPSEIVQRYKFNSCVRRAGESVATFLANLRAVSEHCNYGDTLELMIRDRLVCGVNDKAIQKRLLAESKLTYKRAVEIAQEIEAADHDMKLLHTKKEFEPVASSTASTATVHRVVGGQAKGVTTTTKSCFRCGNAGHIATTCKFRKDVVCHGCGKVGHIKKACHSGRSRSFGSSTGKANASVKTVTGIREETEQEDAAELLKVHSTAGSPPIVVQVVMDGNEVTMEVDTGAAVSLMSEKVFREMWPKRRLFPTKVRLCNYTKDPIQLFGCCNVNIQYEEQAAVLPLLIVAGSGPTLLGRDWLGHITLDWKSIITWCQLVTPYRHCWRSIPVCSRRGWES